ncbi:YfjI family protein [Kutzneria buriramensis]|uniref:Uncharacterized protein DUF3987 n=1 Tax=Kutzneria buriramensis TaxID=1045776 RepID=A0A3E0GU97_9PSEU|nr:YfjI family protein [Kutzneria buriramensis]REH26011.1 uncharacterized protein DUF3987 [Kutzneria buriramensis]
MSTAPHAGPAHLRAVPPYDDIPPPAEQVEVWEPPLPLIGARTLPPFPVDALPGWVADMVAAVAEFTQTPPDLAGCIALAALSTAAGGRSVVEIRPGWEEPTNIYTVVVLPPSARKSPVFRAMTRPIAAVERELVEVARPAIEQARITRRTAEALMEQAEARAHKTLGADQDNAMAEAVDAALQAAQVDVPVEPRLLADDITPEQTATLLAQHGGRLAILSAEGGLFGTLAGRYSGSPNLDVFLKGYSGDTHRVDRGGRPPEYIETTTLTIGLTTQPAILEELGKTSLFRGTGLLARFLYSLPVNTVGGRIARPAPVPEQVAVEYDQRLRALVHTLVDWTDPARLVFTPDADDAMAALQDEIEPRLHPVTGAWSHIGDWGGKVAGQTARLAGLIHVAAHPREPWTRPIEADTFAAARRLGAYFAAHALAVFDQLGTDATIRGAQHVLDWLAKVRPERFTVRELFTGISRAQFRKVGDLAPALAVLEEHGHVRRLPDPDRTGQRGRAPSPTYLVHPAHRHP